MFKWFVDCKLICFAMLFLLSSCWQKTTDNQLSFIVLYKEQTIDCNSVLVKGERHWKIQQLQFFISQVEYQTDDGDWYAWPLKTTPYQSDNVALIGSDCADPQWSKGNWSIDFQSFEDLNQVSAIRFSLGVPFALNHLNPLLQESPLNDSSMFWVWQTGHKFLRLEMLSDTDDWLFHLGSTGCKAASAMRAPKNPCLQPNFARFELSTDFSQGINPIVLDLSKLLNDVELGRQSSCQSEPDNEVCQQLFAHLGLLDGQIGSTIFTYD